jgi:hypothetical protein
LTANPILAGYETLQIPTSIDYRLYGILIDMSIDKRVAYLGEGNPKWRGNDAKYPARHVRVRTARGHASEYPCAGDCGKSGFEWAHIHDTDPFDVMNYQAMCVKCHRAYDKPAVLRGEQHPRAKLNWDKVRDIRTRLDNGETQGSLAIEYDVLQGTISKIHRKVIWKEVVPL